MKIKRFLVGSLLCGLSVTALPALADSKKPVATSQSKPLSAALQKKAAVSKSKRSTTDVLKAAARDTKPAKSTFKAAVKSDPLKHESTIPKESIKLNSNIKVQPTAEKTVETSEAFAKAAARINVVVADRKKPSQIRIPFARPEENVTQIMAGDLKRNELFIFSEKENIPENLVEVYPDASMAALGGDEKIAVGKINEFKKTLEKVGRERIAAAQQARIDDAFLKAFSANLDLALNTEKYKQRFEIKVKSDLDPELQTIKSAAVTTPINVAETEKPVKPLFASKQPDFEVTNLSLPNMADHFKQQAFNIKPHLSVDKLLASLNLQDKSVAPQVVKPTVVAYKVTRDDRANLAAADAVKKTIAQFARNYCELNINLYLAFHKPPTHPVFSSEGIHQKFVAMGPNVKNAFASSANTSLNYTLQALAENHQLFAIPVQERQINTALIHHKLDALRSGLNKTEKDQFELAVNVPLSASLKAVAENKETLAVTHAAEAFHENTHIANKQSVMKPAVANSSALLADNSKVVNANAQLHAALEMKNESKQVMPPVVIAENKEAKPGKTFIPKEVSLDDLPKPKKIAKTHTPSADSKRLSKEVLAARERALQKLEQQLAEDTPEPVVISNQAYRDDNERPQPQKKKEVFAEREQPGQVVKQQAQEEEMPPAPKNQMQADAYPGFDEEGDAFAMTNENDGRLAKNSSKSHKTKAFEEDIQSEMKSNTDWGDFGEVDSPSNFAAYDDNAASDDEAFDKSLAMRESSEFSRLMEE